MIYSITNEIHTSLLNRPKPFLCIAVCVYSNSNEQFQKKYSVMFRSLDCVFQNILFLFHLILAARWMYRIMTTLQQILETKKPV